MAEIQRAGIDQIAVSWWGQGSPEDERLPAVVAAAQRDGIDVAVHIEPYSGRTVASVVADIAYLRALGIKTFYIYQAFTGIAPSAGQPRTTRCTRTGSRPSRRPRSSARPSPATSAASTPTTSSPGTRAKFARICAEAHAHGLLCAPSVGPGYDARRATGDPTSSRGRTG